MPDMALVKRKIVRCHNRLVNQIKRFRFTSLHQTNNETYTNMAHSSRWTMSQVTELFEKPLLDLLFEAQQVHRQHFDPRQVQVSTLLSIKTGACPEDCKYCPQSSRYKTGLETERLMEVEQVLDSARKAKQAGSTRFCMGAAWKNPHERDMPYRNKWFRA